MTYKDMIDSKVEMTLSQYLKTYQSIEDREEFEGIIKMYVYFDGYYIEGLPNSKYQVVVYNTVHEFDAIELAEKHLWEEFIRDEMNPQHVMKSLDAGEDFNFARTAIQNLEEKYQRGIHSIKESEREVWENSLKKAKDQLEILEHLIELRDAAK
jgi:hypothetical protein